MVVAAHPDDETFGCGGTLSLHYLKGNPVHVLCLTCNPEDRGEELYEAAKELGIPKPKIFSEKKVTSDEKNIWRIADEIVKTKPNIIFTHLSFDYHREHRVTHEIVKEAIEWAGHTTMYDNPWVVNRLLLMEVNTLIPQPHVNVDISTIFDLKRNAINKFKTQITKFPSKYYEKFNYAKARLRGVQGNCEYSEAFLEDIVASNSPFYQEKSVRQLNS
jgi:LmbE family N-acetylglucosaminyl deacetylase